MSHLNIVAPIVLSGEGLYGISDVKEVKVSKQYLSLDSDIRKCQNVENFESCTTRHLLDDVQKQCNCIPYPLKKLIGSKQVYFNL